MTSQMRLEFRNLGCLNRLIKQCIL